MPTMESYQDPDGKSCFGCPYDRITPATVEYLRGHRLYQKGFLLGAENGDINRLPHRTLNAYQIIDATVAEHEREEWKKREAEARRRG